MAAGLVLTASPEFVAVAMEEVRELAGGSVGLVPLGEGVFFWPTDDPQAANSLILSKPPVFLHHLHLASSFAYAGEEDLQVNICQRLTPELASLPLGSRVAMQGRLVNSSAVWQPRELKQAVDQLLQQLGQQSTVKDPEWIISVTLAGDTVYYGLSAAERNLSDWSGGMIHFRKDPDDISRSKFKLMEAITRWQLDFAAGSLALDLGAAPGGWTSVLLERGLRVIAVDTGELDPRLPGRPGLTFLQRNVRELSLPRTHNIDLITCDMSWNPFFTVRTVNQLVERLAAGAQVILTVKLMGKRPLQTVRQVIERLDPRLMVVHAQHLFHNRQEVTLHLVKA